MRRHLMYALMFCFVFASHALASETSELVPKIESVIQPYVDINDFAGAVLVAEKGEVLYSAGFGYANVELGVRNTPDHRYFIGSISKQFTAAALLMLESQGKLSMADPVSRHLPTYPRGDEITIHHLLTHTSGIPDYFSLPEYGSLKFQDFSLAEVVSLSQNRPLEADPGTRYAYSNAGYCLAARIVEVVSKQSFADFMQEHIFRPLGMADSGVLADRKAVLGLVSGYDPMGLTGLKPATQPNPAFNAGCGSVYSTVEDLLRWDRALYTDRALPDSARTKMMTDYGNAYGYGVSVFERFEGRVVEHDGRIAGYASDLARYLDHEYVVIILGNIQSVARDRIRDDIGYLLHGQTPPERTLRSVEPPTPARVDLSKLAGAYSFGPNFVVHVKAAPDRLLLQANQGEVSEFFPMGAGDYYSRTLYAGCSFELNDSGEPVAMMYKSGGGSFRGEFKP